MEPLIAPITNQIYLGNIRAAMDDTILQKHKITGILNVCEHQYMTSQAELFCCPLKDNEDNKPATLLAACYMLDELKSKHGSVLIHCHHGGSRSVGVLMLYLVLLGKTGNFDVARDYIQNKYPLKLSQRQPRPGIRQLAEQALTIARR